MEDRVCSLPANGLGAKAAAEVLDVQKKTELIPFIGPMRHAALHCNKPVLSQLWEIWRFSLGRNRVSPEEYYDLRLFDDAGRSFADKQQFLGLTGGRRLTMRCNSNPHWFGVMNDKLAFYCMMKGYGFPVPDTVAFYHPKAVYPNFQILRNDRELGSYLRTTNLYPLFAKPMSSSLSMGVASLHSYDKSSDRLHGRYGQSFSVGSFVNDVRQFYGDGYLIQRELRPAAEIAEMCGPYLSTLRVMTIYGRHGPEILRLVWKIPVAGNVADNFWRKGNLLADVDQSTGVIRRLIQGHGIDQERLTCHPETKRPMVGEVMPGWKEIVDLALSACEVLRHVRLVGWDIASTVGGAVIVEANGAPHFDLPQIASNQGMLDQRLRDFVRCCETERKQARLRNKKAMKKGRREYRSKIHKLTIGHQTQ